MARFIHDGGEVDYTSVADVAAGAVVVQGELVGVANIDIKATRLGALAVTGVFDFPKAVGGGTAITMGANTYWAVGAQQATTNAAAGANKLIGKTIKAALDADTLVRVRLMQ